MIDALSVVVWAVIRDRRYKPIAMTSVPMIGKTL